MPPSTLPEPTSQHTNHQATTPITTTGTKANLETQSHQGWLLQWVAIEQPRQLHRAQVQEDNLDKLEEWPIHLLVHMDSTVVELPIQSPTITTSSRPTDDKLTLREKELRHPIWESEA